MPRRQFLLTVTNERVADYYTDHSTYHQGDAGLDLFIVEDTVIKPGETLLVDLGISCYSRSFSWCTWKWLMGRFFKYHSYMLVPRSSIYKTPIILHNSVGIIDAGYCGNIKAPLYNTSNEPFTLRRGTRYVQLINGDLSPVSCKLVTETRETDRGSSGFGSTGQ